MTPTMIQTNPKTSLRKAPSTTRRTMVQPAVLAALLSAAVATPALAADEVKIGVLLSFTGPIESLTPAMAGGAEMAMSEVSESGKLLDGTTIKPVRADATCVDSGAATTAAERLVTSDGVKALVGPDCSGVTGAVLANVAVPNGLVLVSPSATSPALSTAEDKDLFFRTAPSDARQGEVMAEVLNDQGITSAALTYTNNDYGKGLADSIEEAFTANDGELTISAAHEDGKADYSSEVASLASAGGDALIVVGYLDQGGKGIMQAALDTGAFDTFALLDGMIGSSLTNALGSDIDGSFGTVPGTDSPGAKKMAELAEAGGFASDSPYVGESYDAAALVMLAMQAAESVESGDFAGEIIDLANAPGEQIFPGELAKALEIIADGGDIDYEGATAVEMTDIGETEGSYREVLIEDGKLTTAGYR